MELVEGGTLRELLRERGPMPPHAVAAVLAPVLSGLAVAHRAGLVHRDIKPENVLISDDGEVKIADFGLVRAVAEAKITSTSVILGTAAYLSPEQVGTGDAGPRSDVYAVGVLAYELLTGDTPFTGDTALAVAYQRMDNDVAAAEFGDRRRAAAIRRTGAAGDRARSRQRYADAAGHGRRTRRHRRRAAAARLPGARAAQLGAARRRPARAPQPGAPVTATTDAAARRASPPANSPAAPTTGRTRAERTTTNTRACAGPFRRHRRSTSSTGRGNAPGGCCCSG